MVINLNVAIEQLGKQLDEIRDERDRLRALVEDGLQCMVLPMGSAYRTEWQRDARAILAEIPESPIRPMTTYRLPDGSRVKVCSDVCRRASEIDYTLANGQLVKATKV